MTKRIGFCCKYVKQTGTGIENIPETALKSTTSAWLKRQTTAQAEAKLWEILIHNLAATRELVRTVGTFRHRQRMVRLGSDILPFYTEPTWRYFWQQPTVKTAVSNQFSSIGDLARNLDVRLSFHPGQFCCVASERDDVVTRSLEEFEYHADMARYMGYGSDWHDHGFKINIHISGRRGVEGVKAVMPRLSKEAINLISIENDEVTWGLESILELEHHSALVLDIHHHFIKTGEYISPTDDRVKRVRNSWRGIRPTLHYSVSRENVLPNHPTDQLLDLNLLLSQGHTKQKLRAHSDWMWNSAVNDWALEFWETFDIQVESKYKNLASFALYNYAVEKGY